MILLAEEGVAFGKDGYLKDKALLWRGETDWICSRHIPWVVQVHSTVGVYPQAQQPLKPLSSESSAITCPRSYPFDLDQHLQLHSQMAPYESWNILAEEDELDLVDLSSQMKDVILFCIDAASSMQDTRPDTSYDESSGAMESNLLKCLESAILIMKKKVIVGPSDQVGVMLFNTVRSLYARWALLCWSVCVEQARRKERWHIRDQRWVLLASTDRSNIRSNDQVVDDHCWTWSFF